jgi:hypothetical protein
MVAFDTYNNPRIGCVRIRDGAAEASSIARLRPHLEQAAGGPTARASPPTNDD